FAAAIAVATVAGVGLTAPDEARVERSIKIVAPKERVMPLAAAMLGCAADAACSTRSDGLVRRLADRDTLGPTEPLPAGFATFRIEETAGGVVANYAYSTRLRDAASAWAKPFAAYRGLILRRELAIAFERSLETLKNQAEKDVGVERVASPAADPL
ncbi:MAG: hypothetical protein K2Q06_08650, partial [Parvularculaceae bacterium]|nr:hypothetical protein [Parvularculaceae bacterium]